MVTTLVTFRNLPETLRLVPSELDGTVGGLREEIAATCHRIIGSAV